MIRKEASEFAETADFCMADGKRVYYGSLKKDYKEGRQKCIILTPAGLESVKNKSIPVIAFYVDVSNQTIKERLRLRGDNHEEAERRLKADNSDFLHAKELADFIIKGTDDPEGNADRIIALAEDHI